MFDRLNKWLAKRKTKKALNKSLEFVDNVMRTNDAAKVEPTYYPPFEPQTYTTTTWRVNDIAITRLRFIRADLVTVVNMNGEEIAGWIDQNFTFGIGKNDIAYSDEFLSLANS